MIKDPAKLRLEKPPLMKSRAVVARSGRRTRAQRSVLRPVDMGKNEREELQGRSAVLSLHHDFFPPAQGAVAMNEVGQVDT